MSQVAVGDTNRAGSEAKLSVGALQCHGDREFLSLHFNCVKKVLTLNISIVKSEVRVL